VDSDSTSMPSARRAEMGVDETTGDGEVEVGVAQLVSPACTNGCGSCVAKLAAAKEECRPTILTTFLSRSRQRCEIVNAKVTLISAGREDQKGGGGGAAASVKSEFCLLYQRRSPLRLDGSWLLCLPLPGSHQVSEQTWRECRLNQQRRPSRSELVLSKSTGLVGANNQSICHGLA